MSTNGPSGSTSMDPDAHLCSPGLNGVKEGEDALLLPVILYIMAILVAKRFFTGLESVRGEPSKNRMRANAEGAKR